jgi:Asp-tRNA(Asn)/Glu-tRNA(Gln) amidotransferase B subunit
VARRYRTELGLDAETTKTLTDDLTVALYFEEALANGADIVETAKWLTGAALGGTLDGRG